MSVTLGMGGGKHGRKGSGQAERGLSRGEGCTGTGRGRASGTGGLISGILDLVGTLIRARKAREIVSIGAAGNPDVRRIDALPARGHETPEKSRSRQIGDNPLLASVDLGRCSGCGICAQVCPAGAISVEQVASVDTDKCTGCGQCVAECPRDALILKKA